MAIEQWAVSADGRVAIVCPKPYRVRLIDASGRETAGPILPFTPVRVTEAEKQAWRDDHAGPVLVLRFGANGQKTTGYEKHPVPEPESWPAAMPPFTMQLQWRKVLAFDPTGMLWIVRSTAADAPPSFDVVDRAGRLAYHVSAPLHTRLVGFGRNTVYLVRRDDDDIEHLQRYALPH